MVSEVPITDLKPVPMHTDSHGALCLMQVCNVKVYVNNVLFYYAEENRNPPGLGFRE